MNLDGKTTAELIKLRELIENNPDNRQTGKLYLFTPKARRKLDHIAWAIIENLAAARAARGDPVPTCGYSGRQSNKRR